jgi:hypothetical protein
MRIKKFRNNEYVLADSVWVRNPSAKSKAVDINSMSRDEVSLFVRNEQENSKCSYMQMEEATGSPVADVVVASDGFGWRDRQMILGGLPNSAVNVFGVNGSLARWSMVGENAPVRRTMAFYVANNPYSECMSFLPKAHRYYPNIVASTRTNPEFLAAYRSQPYMYRPTPDLDYAGSWGVGAVLDDYRNPVCAAISLAVWRGATRILLLCCDESFEDERPGAVRMKNGLWQYPQQITCQRVIDRQLFWLRRMGIRVGDCSSGIEYENAEYIRTEDIMGFFGKEGNGQV